MQLSALITKLELPRTMAWYVHHTRASTTSYVRGELLQHKKHLTRQRKACAATRASGDHGNVRREYRGLYSI